MENELEKIDLSVKKELNFTLKLQQRDNYLKSIKEILIKDEATFSVATEMAGKVKTFLTEIEEARKLVKKPYADAAKKVDDVAKEIVVFLQQEQKLLEDKILIWKNLQIEKAKQAATEMKGSIEEWKIKHEQIIKDIARISEIILSRTFGGSYIAKDGETKACVEPKTLEEIDTTYAFVETKFPAEETFGDFFKQARMIQQIGLTVIAGKKEQIKVAVTSDVSDRQEKYLIEQSLLLQKEARKQFDKIKEGIDAEFASKLKGANKTAENQVVAASKGIRKYVAFSALDIAKVPMEYHMIDEDKIKAFISENSDLVKKAIKEGTELIPGVSFFYTTTNVVAKK